MKTRLLNLWEKLGTSFWLVPGGMAVAAVVLSWGTASLDRRLGGEAFEGLPWLRYASADGVRALLSTVATSMLTTAGVVFSVTIVALTMASSQFGPRLLRNFIRARSTQAVLGALLGTFVYCLLMLRFVRSGAGVEASTFIPHLSVLVALGMTLATLGLFIYFIHAIAVSLQADRIVSEVNQELAEDIERFFGPEPSSDRRGPAGMRSSDRPPDGDGEEVRDDGEADANGGGIALGKRATAIRALREGYVQAIDVEGMLARACRSGMRVELTGRPGRFVHAGGLLGRASSDEGEVSDEDREALARAFLIGNERTPEQDFEFCIRQLVEIALRALSPGINDPFTAMTCIDFLGAAVGRMAGRRFPRSVVADDDGEPRIALRPVTFDAVLESAFNQLRQESVGKVAVSIRLLEAFERIGEQARTSAQRESVLRHARMIAAASGEAAAAESDRADIGERLERIEALVRRRNRDGNER